MVDFLDHVTTNGRQSRIDLYIVTAYWLTVKLLQIELSNGSCPDTDDQ